ncbi:GNAT family N-acetyltransferase [Alkalihalobacillus sp. R86527]|uniref:GNAT family N-acetyltransferase n=1 Tax=Alkalihalobacillus sp. R86527 TaxID=3093863 RepID=UPI00366BA3D9
MNKLTNNEPFIQTGSLSIRRLGPGDEELLLKWLTNKNVLQYYEGRDCLYTLDKIQDDYFTREDIIGCIVSFNAIPIGYVQFYRSSSIKWLTLPQETYGMDQFIGEPAYWNKGIGTELVTTVVDYLVGQGASLIVMDPQTRNERAIACYEKAGFEKKCILKQHEWHEGAMRDCQLMFYDASLTTSPIKDEDRTYIKELFEKSWGSNVMVLSSGVYHCNELDGFCIRNGKGDVEGLITYVFRDDLCEIISLDSFKERSGIGSKLLLEVEMATFHKGLGLITLITTNDNLHALQFYQKRGYRLTGVNPGAVDEARRIKKEIPEKGYYDIPIHDELQITKSLK